jgi:hypothetical protein
MLYPQPNENLTSTIAPCHGANVDDDVANLFTLSTQKVSKICETFVNIFQVNIFFVNVVTDDGSWRATERDATQSTQYRPPLVPSAFIQRFFPEATFPLPIRLIVELNGELQEQVWEDLWICIGP